MAITIVQDVLSGYECIVTEFDYIAHRLFIAVVTENETLEDVLQCPEIPKVGDIHPHFKRGQLVAFEVKANAVDWNRFEIRVRYHFP